jgi:ribosomal protein S18 acetylase RimI-like enzyme
MTDRMRIDLNVRLASRQDATGIANLSRDYIEHGLRWNWTAARIVRAIERRTTNVVVAHELERLVGFGIMDYADDTAHLALMGVQPTHRRCGVGRRLIGWLLACAETAGIPCIRLEARADNPGALAFYERLGFEPAGRVPGYYAGLIDAVRLERWLWRPSQESTLK